MTTKHDSFMNEYIVVDNEFIETILRNTRNYVVRRTYIANNREFDRSFNYITQLIAMKLIHMTYEHQMSRVYIDDVHDFVETHFAID